jgi:hypothetical protein
MIIADIEVIPLRIPFKVGTKSDASAWGIATCRLRTRCLSRSRRTRDWRAGERRTP